MSDSKISKIIADAVSPTTPAEGGAPVVISSEAKAGVELDPSALSAEVEAAPKAVERLANEPERGGRKVGEATAFNYDPFDLSLEKKVARLEKFFQTTQDWCRNDQDREALKRRFSATIFNGNTVTFAEFLAKCKEALGKAQKALVEAKKLGSRASGTPVYNEFRLNKTEARELYDRAELMFWIIRKEVVEDLEWAIDISARLFPEPEHETFRKELINKFIGWLEMIRKADITSYNSREGVRNEITSEGSNVEIKMTWIRNRYDAFEVRGSIAEIWTCGIAPDEYGVEQQMFNSHFVVITAVTKPGKDGKPETKKWTKIVPPVHPDVVPAVHQDELERVPVEEYVDRLSLTLLGRPASEGRAKVDGDPRHREARLKLYHLLCAARTYAAQRKKEAELAVKADVEADLADLPEADRQRLIAKRHRREENLARRAQENRDRKVDGKGKKKKQ